MGIYVSHEDAENWLSAAVVRRIADDNNDGTADDGPLAELINSAEAMFEGAVRDVYSLAELRTSGSFEARRMIRDCLLAVAAQRFPRAMGREWLPLMQHARAQLKDLRNGATALDILRTPEPAANKGGEVLTASVEDGAEPPDPVFLGGTGDF